MNGRDSVVFDGAEYPVSVVFSPKRRTIGLTVKADGEIVLRVPKNASREEAIAFAQSKAEWIVKHLEQFAARQVPHQGYADGDTIPFFGETYVIRRVSGRCVSARFAVEPGTEGSGKEAGGEAEDAPESGAESAPRVLLLTVPEDFSAEEAEDACRSAVMYLFRREGTRRLKPFAEKYAKLSGVAAPQIRVRHQERKWGCCTPKNGIIINVNVLLGPVFVIEYLVAHEVCHLRFRNHQQEFWAEVERVMPGYREAEAVLKKEGWKWVF